jgi:hypothetical protein
MNTRRDFIKAGALTVAGIGIAGSSSVWAAAGRKNYVTNRPAAGERNFVSKAVEETIEAAKAKIKDPKLAWMFENCFPNTLDTTVEHGTLNGKPDTFVITGDIHAMWLRDSTAQVWPYMPLANQDEKLKTLLAGVVHRQTQCVLLDRYANAFNKTKEEEVHWMSDMTDMKPGLHVWPTTTGKLPATRVFLMPTGRKQQL